MAMSFNNEAFRAQDPAGKPGPEPTPDAASAPGPSTSLLADAGALTRQYRATLHAWVELAVLETRLAAKTTVHVVVLAIGLALLLAAAYLSLIGAGVLALISQGLSPTLAMLAATVINLLAATLVFFAVRSKVRSLGWPATSRALKSDPADPADPAATERSRP